MQSQWDEVSPVVEKLYFGEGKNIEFKRKIPKKHEKFLKDIIAFSNCTGGKVILGIEDGTNIVYGIGDANPFKLSDDISNMISDACTPQIISDITIQTLEGRTVLVIDVAPGKFRPYYLKTSGKSASSYIRINGTSRPADARILQEFIWRTGYEISSCRKVKMQKCCYFGSILLYGDYRSLGDRSE